MVSALLMFRRVVQAFRYAVREDDFLNVFGAGVVLVLIGTLTYALGAGWNVVDALYFAVATLTTTSVSDPDLALQDGWLKLFTVFYLLIGIGILVEILRRLGAAFVTVRQAERAEPGSSPPERGGRPPGSRDEGGGARS
jgi:Ion channel